MHFYHTKCGGDVSALRHKCLKCGKKWGFVSILFDSHIRPGMSPEKEATIRKRKPTGYAKWADKYPGTAAVAGRLPKWPRWARVLSSLIVFGGLITLVVWLVAL